MLASIGQIERSSEYLHLQANAASIAARCNGVPLGEVEDARSILPLELRRVLRLSTALRDCFVLRLLIGLTREVCATNSRAAQSKPWQRLPKPRALLHLRVSPDL